jgi:hypothetical protein
MSHLSKVINMNKRFYFKPVFSLFVLLLIFTNCTIYELTEKRVEYNPTPLKLNSRIFPVIVVHIGNATWQIKNPMIDSKTIQGELVKVNEKALSFYVLANEKNKFKVSFKDKNYAKQLHLYTDDIKFNGTQAEIECSKVSKIELIRTSQGIRTLTYGTLAAGASFGAFIIYLINAWG